MAIISNRDWEPLKTANQILIEKWETLKRTHRTGNAEKILAAEMQYLTALQNIVSILQVATSEANIGNKTDRTLDQAQPL